jgi:hypothetical protein
MRTAPTTVCLERTTPALSSNQWRMRSARARLLAFVSRERRRATEHDAKIELARGEHPSPLGHLVERRDDAGERVAERRHGGGRSRCRDDTRRTLLSHAGLP